MMAEQTLDTMGGKELVELHNMLAKNFEDVKAVKYPWKSAKSILVDKVRELQMVTAMNKQLLRTEEAPARHTEEAPKAAKNEVKSPDVAATHLTTEELAFKSPTVRETSLRLLCHVVSVGEDKRTVGLPYDEVVDLVCRLHGSKTTVACLRWYAVKVRAEEKGYEGWKLVQRRPRSKQQAA